MVMLSVAAIWLAGCSVETNEVQPDLAPDFADDLAADDPADVQDLDGDVFTTREDDICLGEQDGEFVYVVGYQVVDGVLGARCWGAENPALVDAWNVLVDIVPPGQLFDLAAFTGFTNEGGDLLAFVTIADDAGSLFEMAVNVEQTDNTEELHLTMVHEFAHVFAATPNELDRGISDRDCATYWNGEGCYTESSIMAEWVEMFWADKVDSFDPTAPESPEDADERCALDPGLFGPYAGTSPEEDFAEAFAAYVLQVPDETDGQLERLNWIDAQPGLREFRDRAISTGYGPQPHNFDPCG